MESISFAHVPVEGFVGFLQTLAEGDWGAIDTTSYRGPNGALTQPIFDAPVAVFCKLRLEWSSDRLAHVREGAGNSKQRDQNWDSTQKRLAALINAALTHPDSLIRAAAERLHKALLLRSGEAQTKLKYQQEVDFGRQQVRIASSGQGAADVALLDLGTVMADVHTTTEALADAIGHGDRHKAPSRQLQAALGGCRTTFAAVAMDLAWIMEFGTTDVNRTHAARLRDPLEALAARYPARQNPPTSDPTDDDGMPPAENK